MVPSHFQQPCVAICPVNRSDEYPHDRTLPFDQRPPSSVTIRFRLTASLGENGFVYHPSGFIQGEEANRHRAGRPPLRWHPPCVNSAPSGQSTVRH